MTRRALQSRVSREENEELVRACSPARLASCVALGVGCSLPYSWCHHLGRHRRIGLLPATSRQSLLPTDPRIAHNRSRYRHEGDEMHVGNLVVFLPLQRAPPSRVPQSLLVLPRLETQGFGAARTNVWLRRPFAFARHLASCCLVSRYEPSFMCASRDVTCTPWAQHVKSSHRVRPS